MSAELILHIITCNCFFLMAFVAWFNPHKVNVVANRWLGLFFAAVGCMVCNVVLYDAGLDAAYPRIIGFNELSRFALAPALYLSIAQFTTPGSKFKASDYLHFIPFTIFFLYMVPFLYFPDYQLIGGHFNLPPKLNFAIGFLVRWSINVQLLVYWVLAFNTLRKHQKHLLLIASDTVPVNLAWLKYLLMSVGGMLVLFFASIFFGIHLSPVVIATGYLLGTLTIFYHSLAQKEIFPFEVSELTAINEVIIADDNQVKPIKQRLSDEQAQHMRIKLESLMTAEKLHLDNELSLPQLADAIGASVHDLSFLLNEKIGLNFFQFVNAYRVEEAKQIMLSDKYKHLNILGIAYSAGFSSKTTFNTVFKTQTGMSPSAFMKQHKSINPSLQS
ncbi:helix-turn-helix domain-containing protein [Mucilaginibacter psychrotolerans]|uniref:AraC family transcriptional regulator n=1 Tax=Mucilaginibacter psychrotolerans TaxID=1524096 RepID=A0A4Y8SD37_9SPHI|nr:AraC family transcriptional regulator [Mucilaginibacter psychrotolerans]TFF36858.1 AraC family transcriptional regulator [Mucilaginibacter psychrotolerans]